MRRRHRLVLPVKLPARARGGLEERAVGEGDEGGGKASGEGGGEGRWRAA